MAKTVYYSPAGGRVLGILTADADAERDYERSLDRTGTDWRKASVTDAKAKEAAHNVAGFIYKDGELEALPR